MALSMQYPFYYSTMEKIRLIGAIFLFAGIAQINGDTAGRLLTPKEGCGFAKVKNTRIVGGSIAPVGAWPWMALLAYELADKIVFDCGGSLITSRHVLTAAHCLSEFADPSTDPKILLFVRLGEHDLTTTDDGEHQDISIELAVPHENYNHALINHDIAMLYLERDVEFSDRIRPICLPLDEPLRSRSFVYVNAFAAGWGDMYKTKSPAQVLMQIQVPVVDHELCKRLLLSMNAPLARVQINDHVLCARLAGGKGVWIGDSGGPLMLPIHRNGTFPFYQIGIVSFGYSFAAKHVPDIYTKVQYYADWIKEHVEG